MADLWYPAAVRDPAPNTMWGSKISTPPKHCLHTTEAGDGVFRPGEGSYFGNPYWPNYTIAIRYGTWVVYQHIPANWTGAALEHPPGTPETNRACTQTEIAWSADRIQSLPAEAKAVIRALLQWEHQVLALPLTSTVTWMAYPQSYGGSAPQRLSTSAFSSYSGVLGHQHVPNNSHGDPGNFPIADVLGGDTLSAEEVKAINDYTKAQIDALKSWMWDNIIAGSPGHPPMAKKPDIDASMNTVLQREDFWGNACDTRFTTLDTAVANCQEAILDALGVGQVEDTGGTK